MSWILISMLSDVDGGAMISWGIFSPLHLHSEIFQSEKELLEESGRFEITNFSIRSEIGLHSSVSTEFLGAVNVFWTIEAL